MSSLILPIGLVTILVTLFAFFSTPVSAQPPPPPPSPFRQPDTWFHGYSIRSFAVDPSAPYVLINDDNTFVHAIDLFHQSRSDMLYFDARSRISAIGMNRRGNPVVLSRDGLLSLFDDQWRPMSNISLPTIDPRVTRWQLSSFYIDTNSYMYFLGMNNTGTYFVNILDGMGVRRDSWSLGTFPTNVSFVWAMDFANNIYFQQRFGTDRPLRVFTSGGVLTDTLRSDLTGVDVINNIAVSPSGNIVLTAGASTTTLLAFDAQFRARGRFSLATVADTVNQMVFDRYNNLWVLDYTGDALLAIAPNGDLLGTLSSDVPSLYNLNSLQYDRQSQSLVFTDYNTFPTAVSRINGQDGSLIQSYILPDRLSNCRDTGMQVTGDSNIWLLLYCFDGRQATEILHVVNRAGKIQREFPIKVGYEFSLDLVVDPYDDRMFILYDTGLFPFNAEYVQAYTLDGSPLFNISFDAITPRVNDVFAMTIAFGALQLLEYAQNRLTWWSIYNGTLLGNISLGGDIALSLATDRNSFFISRYTVNRFTGLYNSSVLRFDQQGNLLEQYVFGPQQQEGVFSRIVLNDMGDRLWGYDEYYGTIVMWRVERRGEEAGQATGEVKRIEPIMVTKGEGGAKGEVEGKNSPWTALKGKIPRNLFEAETE